MLGSHIGSDKIIQTEVKKQTDKVKDMMDKAANLSDPQCAMLLLSNCFDCCRMTYLMRTIEPAVIEDILMDFDKGLKGAVDKVIGKVQTDAEFDNFTLKVKMEMAYAYLSHLNGLSGSFAESKPV